MHVSGNDPASNPGASVSPLRIALVGAAAAFSLALGFVVLAPTEYTVQRSIVIAAPARTIVPLVAQLPARQAWIPWTETDPDAEYSYTGQPGAIGSTMAWRGEQIGEAMITIEVVEPEQVVTKFEMKVPMESTSTDSFTFVEVDGGTRVTWTNHADGLPLGPARVFALFADSLLGPDYEKGLDRLRTHIERPVASN
jgi:hypothetical protein